MPFTDSFIQNFVGYQESPNRLYQDSPPANTQISATPNHDPQKIADRLYCVAIPFVNTYSQSTGLVSMYQANAPNRDLGKFQVSYSEVFQAWDGSQIPNDFNRIVMTFNNFTITNNTVTDQTFRGIELVDPIFDAVAGSLPAEALQTTFVITRDGSVGPLPRYTTVEPYHFGRLHKVFEDGFTISSVSYIHQLVENDDGVFVPQEEPPNTDTDTDTRTMVMGGKFSIARYNFPSNIILQPSESINVGLGTIELTFESPTITCSGVF